MTPRTAFISIFFHLPVDTYFFPFFLSFAFHHCCMQCFDHRFCRWCRHSLVSYISSVVPTLDAPFYFVGGADTPPPSVHINPPPPCVHQVARTKIEDKIGEGHSNKPTIPYLPMEFPSPHSRKDRVSVPEGVHVKMCLCGTPCRLMRSTDPGYTYGRRYWMCANYKYDPPQDRFSSNMQRVIHKFRILYKILILTPALDNI